jgi:chloramphenicol 3-O-phosphotransferase
MADVEAAAREQLAEIVRDLEAMRFRLLGVQASLPAAPGELVRQLDVEEMDAATEIRTVIQCVLDDHIEPTVRDLRKAASQEPP